MENRKYMEALRSLRYTPANPDDWGGVAPTTLAEALDILVARAKPDSLMNPGDFYFPTTLPGIHTWVRADLGVTIGAANNRVVNWVDQISGNEFANISDNSTNPVWNDQTINTHPSIRFTQANSQFLEATDASKYPISDYPITIVAVSRPNNVAISASNYQPIVTIGAGNTVGGKCAIGFGSWGITGATKFGPFIQSVASNGATTNSMMNPYHGNAAGLWNVNGAKLNSSDTNLWIGSSTSLGGAAAGQVINSQAFDSYCIGGYKINGALSTYFSDHDIAEIMVFNTYIEDATWDLIALHIAEFYDFTLPTPI